jgi:hypothetical protein
MGVRITNIDLSKGTASYLKYLARELAIAGKIKKALQAQAAAYIVEEWKRTESEREAFEKFKTDLGATNTQEVREIFNELISQANGTKSEV